MALKLVLNNPAPKKIGLAIVAKIREKTLVGIDKDGKKFKGYSRRPLTIAESETTRTAVNNLIRTGKATRYFDDDTPSLYIKGGYLALKAAKRPKDGGVVNLSDTGQMLRALTVVRAEKDKIQIGFTSTEQARKMLANQKLGRDPMGIKDSELSEIADDVLNSGNFIDLVEF